MTESQLSPFDMANAIRFLAIDAVEKAKSGHPGMPMGMADVATVLFTKFLKFDSKNPNWPDRDRFVLSAGHGSMLLYSLLYLLGYPGMSLKDLQNFRKVDSPAAGHPEWGYAPGIETTTGPLGQGLANAVGMALGEKILAQTFSKELVDHYTYTIVGDGCLMEGISQEAISLAGHLNLSKLIVFFDNNHITIDGPTSLSVSEDTLKRFESANWHVQAINGHNPNAIEEAIKAAQEADKPSLIACETTIAYGADKKAGTAAAHGAPLGPEEIQKARENLKWPYAPFEIPEALLKAWREAGEKGNSLFQKWQEKFSAQPQKVREEFERRLKGDLPVGISHALDAFIEKAALEKQSLATRQSSQKVLDALHPLMPELLGGSADLTGSNNTQAKGMQPITPTDFKGSYVYYGVREHAMGAIMNGLALHGGFIPYGGTFLTFSDYVRPAIRLSALMKQRVIYVMTHDSIGLGEDGPTHQPIEHLASLRAIPNLYVFRPADTIETAECWEIALQSQENPSLIALSRQALPLLRGQERENLSARGAYLIKESKGERQITLLATGSEVSLALDVFNLLEKQGVRGVVVSMPCLELFDLQEDAYREEILRPKTLRVAIEAASPFGWHKYVGEKGLIFGIDTFGLSGPAPDVYKHFHLTAEEIATTILKSLEKGV